LLPLWDLGVDYGNSRDETAHGIRISASEYLEHEFLRQDGLCQSQPVFLQVCPLEVRGEVQHLWGMVRRLCFAMRGLRRIVRGLCGMCVVSAVWLRGLCVTCDGVALLSL